MTTEYYSHDRADVASLIPRDAKRVLDVGCGEGKLGGFLKADRPGLEVFGIELFPEAHARATRVLDRVHQGDASAGPPEGFGAFDCLVFADVLEHCADPWATLAAYKRALAPGGRVVVSIPNVTHWRIRGDLLFGRFRYADEGILDRTHLRFFDAASARELLPRAGYELVTVRRALDDWPYTPRLRLPYPKRRVVDGAPSRLDPALDVLTYQFLMVGR